MKTGKITVLALMIAVAMILSYVESLLPSAGIPGVKLGFANIAVIFVLYRFGWREALAVSVIRVGMVSVLFGSLGAILYSASGAVLSLAVMMVLKRVGVFSETGVSVAGGVGHNAGQILAAVVLLGTARVSYYFPVLIVSGVAGGVFTGLTAALLLRRIPERKQ